MSQNKKWVDWIGREEQRSELLGSSPLSWLAALLDHANPPWREGHIPPLAHWLYCLPAVPQSDLGDDGHPRLGQFLPPIPLPRRMWAASHLEFLLPLQIGQTLTKRSVIKAVEHKSGRSGELIFVSLQHELWITGQLAVRELQELVYRDRPTAPPACAASPQDDRVPPAHWERLVSVDPVLLFRFSAATFNSHRIHYDRDYAVKSEGYPGLVVHGPLIATMLMDLFLRHNGGSEIDDFRFRAQSPVFDSQPFALRGAIREAGTADLWAVTPDRRVVMTAVLRYT